MTVARRGGRPLPAIAASAGPVIDRAGDVVELAPILLGQGETGDPIGIDIERLVDGRLLIQGMSGAGKSWLLRRILESTAHRIQQVILDPEGEFGSLAEHYGHVALDASRLDPLALTQAAARARELRLSLWLDLSQLERGPQMAAVAAVLSTLVLAPANHWHPCLVAVDEVHLFAPQGGSQGAAARDRRASMDAVADLMSRGRKRGLCGVLATQRLVKLAKSVAAEAGNVLVGRNVLELDVARAAEAIGWAASKAMDRLPHLSAGTFVAVGPAFTRSPVVVGIGPVNTRHRGSTPRLGAPPPRTADGAALVDLAELLAASDVRAAARTSGVNAHDVSAVRRFLGELGAPAAALVLRELRRDFPLPFYEDHLAAALRLTPAELGAGLSLLQDFGLAQSGVGESGPTVRATC